MDSFSSLDAFVVDEELLQLAIDIPQPIPGQDQQPPINEERPGAGTMGAFCIIN
ncbi:fungal mating-type pheromone [Coprinopsis cinerea okayama7|uniref:Fungal mating-type pheromone n=2 Tax=Coprinopsis cinerea TaxID=5346 RepID=A8NKB0_COPC7|nr:fungal mating-type pheromone [Coprinopsis cinerea okayama7\|eukprot:XP_001834397.1 fungal mating-type pheromone [Coprinopsis cinerea okayama7\